MGLLDHFIALELATTGVDPADGEIVRISATRFRDGAAEERFDQFVKPSRGLPPNMELLTGVSEADLRDAGTIESAIVDFQVFAGVTPLFAHNAAFAHDFLSAAAPNAEYPVLYDSLELSRIAVPRLRDHRLSTLFDAFGIPDDADRQTPVSEKLGLLILMLADTLGHGSVDKPAALFGLARETELPEPYEGRIADVLHDVMQRAAKAGVSGLTPPHIRPEFLVSFPNTIGHSSDRGGFTERLEPVPMPSPVEDAEVRAAFAPDGPLARMLPQYEEREPQVEMASAVAQALNEEELLAAEAGTGTGKSLAYLVPAVLWAVENDHRIVISTNTKTLQEQLFYKDLPLLQQALKIDFRAALVKGRGNYVCLNRWRGGDAPGMNVTTDRDRGIALPIASWIDETQSGDISENTAFSTAGGPGRALWSRLSAEGQPCTPNACPCYNECYLIRIRRAAQNAHIVVVNHSLLFSDIVAERAVLGEYHNLILDEAHNLERVATQYLGAELSWWEVRDLLNVVFQRDGHESGLLARINRELPRGAMPQSQVKTFQVQVSRCMDATRAVAESAQRFFELLGETLPRPDRFGAFAHKERYTPDATPFDGCLTERDGLLEVTEELGSELSTLTEWLRELSPGMVASRDEWLVDLENRIADLVALVEMIVDITNAEREHYVYWYEIPPDGAKLSTRLFAAPLRVGDLLRDDFFPNLRSCIMTSATLAVAEKFTYFLEHAGLTGSVAERVRTLAVQSPFDFDEQAIVGVPAWMPSPKASGFQDAVTELVRDVVLRTRRGTLVLFTSYRQLNDTRRAVQDDFAKNGILLLSQGIDGSRTNLADSFRRDRESVLFGTESFWQGVDVPGDALEMLIIVRLPFSVPSEPLAIAQGELLRSEGKDPFLWMSVPEAAIRFRQGFGRLIRSQSDRGVVLILDTRVVTERFGRAFSKSLPTELRQYQSPEDLLGELEEWFARPPKSP